MKYLLRSKNHNNEINNNNNTLNNNDNNNNNNNKTFTLFKMFFKNDSSVLITW